MYDSGKIIAGLIVFVLFAAFPFYANFGTATEPPKLDLNTPEIQKMTEKKCVESKEYMRAEHMQLLNTWRDDVVRNEKHEYVNSEGKKFNISLQNTCMKCHSNKKKFCDRCHTYMAVKPYCWDCHIAPKEAEL